MKRIRQIHLYLGVLFAPLIVFFALTGAVQTFGWHEAPKGSTYSPPPWLATLAELHKKQRTQKVQGVPSSYPLKWFVVLMSLGLVASSLSGIYMAFQYKRDGRIVWGLIILGTLLPITLIFF